MLALSQPDQPEPQKAAEFGAALGWRHLVWWQGVGAGSIGVHRVSHRANATHVSAENNTVQRLMGSLRKGASQIGMKDDGHHNKPPQRARFIHLTFLLGSSNRVDARERRQSAGSGLCKVWAFSQ